MARSKPSGPRSQLTLAFDALRDYGCLTDVQLEQLTGHPAATIRKQMSRQALTGTVVRAKLRQGKLGRPISLNCLPESPWIDAASRHHQKLLNDVRIAFNRAWGTDPMISVKTWDTQQISIKGDESPGRVNDHVRPDGIVLFKHSRASRPLVILLEIDCGTEPLARSGTRQTSWSQKALLYQDILRIEYWRDWVRDVGSVGGDLLWRLGIITTSASRISGLMDVLNQQPPALAVWTTTFNKMNSDRINSPVAGNVAAPIWRPLDDDQDRCLIC